MINTDDQSTINPNVTIHMPRDVRDSLRWLAARATREQGKRVTMVDMVTKWVKDAEDEALAHLNDPKEATP